MNIDSMPPNGLYERIIEQWPEVGSHPYVLFAYEPNIYNPSGKEIPFYMLEHEKVHLRQQKEIGGPEIWWDKYLSDSAFRLAQELEAYQKEYQVFCAMFKDKNQRNSFLQFQALMISAPVYGSMITASEARKQIKNGN